MYKFFEEIIELIDKYDREKKAQGFIPTVEMLVEELKEKLNTLNANKNEQTTH